MIHEQKMNTVLQTETEWKLGCGDKFRFWEDRWVRGGEALMRKYPRLYQVSCQQQRLIQQAGRQTKTVWEWNLEWRRPLFDNEVDAAFDLWMTYHRYKSKIRSLIAGYGNQKLQDSTLLKGLLTNQKIKKNE